MMVVAFLEIRLDSLVAKVQVPRDVTTMNLLRSGVSSGNGWQASSNRPADVFAVKYKGNCEVAGRGLTVKYPYHQKSETD